jgi:hypothetical protein
LFFVDTKHIQLTVGLQIIFELRHFFSEYPFIHPNVFVCELFTVYVKENNFVLLEQVVIKAAVLNTLEDCFRTLMRNWCQYVVNVVQSNILGNQLEVI